MAEDDAFKWHTSQISFTQYTDLNASSESTTTPHIPISSPRYQRPL